MAYQEAQGSPLFDLMSEMAKDENLRRDFFKDPRGTMKSRGIRDDQMDLILRSLEGNRSHDFFKAIGDEAAEKLQNPDRVKTEFC